MHIMQVPWKFLSQAFSYLYLLFIGIVTLEMTPSWYQSTGDMELLLILLLKSRCKGAAVKYWTTTKNNAIETQGENMWLDVFTSTVYFFLNNGLWLERKYVSASKIGKEESQSLKNFMNVIYFQYIT